MSRLVSAGLDGLSTFVLEETSRGVNLRVEHRTTGIGVTVLLSPAETDRLTHWLAYGQGEHHMVPAHGSDPRSSNTATGYRTGGYVEFRGWPFGRREAGRYSVTLDRSQIKAVIAWLKIRNPRP